MKRKNFEHDQCAIVRTLDELGDWWTLLIIRHSLSGVRRFKDFQKVLGVAKNILTDRLRHLVEHQILTLVPASDGTKFMEYAPTEKCRALLPVMVALAQWGHEYLFVEHEEQSVVVDKRSSEPVEKIVLKSSAGTALGAEDLLIRLQI